MLSRSNTGRVSCPVSLILDPALRARMGQAGRVTVEDGFSVLRTAAVYLRAIDSVLEQSERAVRRSQAPAQA
jgi:hypothetical protein